MKSVILVAFALVAIAAALPVEEYVPILESNQNVEPDGSYTFGFKTGDGVQRSEEGNLKEAFDEENKPHQVIVVRGTYTYTNDEGKPETVSYFADETGYHAEGASIPKPDRT